MEFIASFSFLHCQFLPLLTSDLPPSPPSTSAHSTSATPSDTPPSLYTLSSPVVLLSLSFPLTLLIPRLPRFPVASLDGEYAGIQTAKPVRMSLGRHFPSSLWQ